MAEAHAEVTRLLSEIPGRPAAVDELLPLVYGQLRSIAQQQFRGEAVGHTLQATALVHEAYLRLLGTTETSWEDRGHFFRVAAAAMRNLLIDHARKRKSHKRGGGKKALSLTTVDLAQEENCDEFLAVDDALQKLEREDARAAEVIRLRFYAGLSVEEVAAVLGLSERTVTREWSYGRARLCEMLSADDA